MTLKKEIINIIEKKIKNSENNGMDLALSIYLLKAIEDFPSKSSFSNKEIEKFSSSVSLPNSIFRKKIF